jgi:hypothetical protein
VCERAHRALSGILSIELGTGMAKGGEVAAIATLDAALSRAVSDRLKKLARAARER